MKNYHTSVLLNEAIDYLRVEPGKKYIDATLGGGGHTFEILKSGGQVLSLDVDEEAIDFVREQLKNKKENIKIGIEKLKIVRGNFRYIDEIANNNGFNQVSGIIFDLGVSGHQLDTGERGFSFSHNAPLDMRMDKDLQVTAADLLKVLTKGELYALFTEFGEERFSGRIVSNIVEFRRVKPIETTADLVEIVLKSVPYQDRMKHPATRIFQALRIAVNDELGSLQEALRKAPELLEPGGRMVVIAFHSLEDKIVKHAFRDWELRKKGKIITKKPVLPNSDEITGNLRSRSAKLRVFEKI